MFKVPWPGYAASFDVRTIATLVVPCIMFTKLETISNLRVCENFALHVHVDGLGCVTNGGHHLVELLSGCAVSRGTNCPKIVASDKPVCTLKLGRC